jgi:hypothetical protein
MWLPALTGPLPPVAGQTIDDTGQPAASTTAVGA